MKRNRARAVALGRCAACLRRPRALGRSLCSVCRAAQARRDGEPQYRRIRLVERARIHQLLGEGLSDRAVADRVGRPWRTVGRLRREAAAAGVRLTIVDGVVFEVAWNGQR